MYLLINEDNSINFGAEHPVNPSLNLEGLRLLEFPEKSLAEVVGELDPEEAYWDEASETVIRDPRLREWEIESEIRWKESEMRRVESLLAEYDRDASLPEDLRVSKLTEETRLLVLKYRKDLSEYNGLDASKRPTYQIEGS